MDILAMVIVEAVKLIPSLIQGVIEGLIAGIALVVQAVWKLGKAIIEGFKNLFGIHSPSAVMKELAGFLVKGVVEGIKNLPSSMWETLQKAYQKVVTWASDLAAKGKEGAKKLFDNVVSSVSGLPNKMLEIGRNLVQGLWNGISNAKDWILSKISGFCSSILDGITGFFDIHSPSRKMAYVGEMLDEGLAGGIEENTDSPVTAIRRMAWGLMDETAVTLHFYALFLDYNKKSPCLIARGFFSRGIFAYFSSFSISIFLLGLDTHLQPELLSRGWM